MRIIEEREGRRSGGGRKTLWSEARKASSRKKRRGKRYRERETSPRVLVSRKEISPTIKSIRERGREEERRGARADEKREEAVTNGKVEAGAGAGAETGGSELTV